MELTKEHKWILVSCLQKAIRRGHVELTKKYTEYLLNLDKNYLLYRLSIMAIEDIGIANLDLIGDFLSAKIKKDEIEKRGGNEYILSIAQEMAKSTKDRTACDLISLAFYADHNWNEISSKIDYKEHFLNKDAPIIQRVMASWEILGTKKMKNDLIKNTEDGLINFLELNKKLGVSDQVLKIIEDSYAVHREPHLVAIGLLDNIFKKEVGSNIGNTKYIAGDYVEKTFQSEILLDDIFLIEGVDWHTKEGKAAVYDFCRKESNIISYLFDNDISKENIPRVVGKLLFRASGQQVNKRLIYQTAISVIKLAQNWELKSNAENNFIEYSQASKLFEKDLQLMNETIEKRFKKPDPKLFPF